MNAQMKSEETPIECASCGTPIIAHTHSKGRAREFCSEKCQRAGRAFCKGCREPLIQSTGHRQRKIWCSHICMKRYRRMGEVTSTYMEARQRTECIVCGDSITQVRNGPPRKYCSAACTVAYLRTGRDKQSINEEWGTFAPETRKALREVQNFMGKKAALRFATAIDREYILRGRKISEPERTPHHE